MKFLEAVGNIFRIPDLRKRLLFALAMLAVYRLGGNIPIPGIDTHRFEDYIRSNQGSLFGFLDLFSGGAFRRLTIFALGIMPYITSSIILQLLTVVVPTLEKLQKEGEIGRRKITQWTRYLTVGLALVQSYGIAFTLSHASTPFVNHPGFSFTMMTILTLTTGTAFIMWLGEQITERGIGNGMSLIIFTGIVIGLPSAIVQMVTKVQTGDWPFIQVFIIVLMMIAVVGFIVLVERGERRIPVQYAKRVIGRRMMGGQSTHLPLKVNAGGVIPVIFASSLLAFPMTAMQFDFVKNSPVLSGMLGAIQGASPLYYLLLHAADYFLLLLLRIDYFQPERSGGQYAQVRRIYPGHPSGAKYRRLHEQDFDQDHGGGRPVPGRSIAAAADHDCGHQAPASAADGEFHRCAFSALVAGRLGG